MGGKREKKILKEREITDLFFFLILLYSKSDRVPTHWPCWTLGPMHHMSPHPREERHLRKQTSSMAARAKVSCLLSASRQLVDSELPRAAPFAVWQLAYGELPFTSLQLINGELPPSRFVIGYDELARSR